MNETVQKVALVTGAAQGIGSVIAKHFALAGYEVAAIDVDNEALVAMAEHQSHARIHPIHCDVSDEASVSDVVRSVASNQPDEPPPHPMRENAWVWGRRG